MSYGDSKRELRERLTCAVVNGLLASGRMNKCRVGRTLAEETALCAIAYADACIAALSATESKSTPSADVVTVPANPTAEMIWSGLHYLRNNCEGIVRDKQDIEHIYRAMLAARPNKGE